MKTAPEVYVNSALVDVPLHPNRTWAFGTDGESLAFYLPV